MLVGAVPATGVRAQKLLRPASVSRRGGLLREEAYAETRETLCAENWSLGA